MTWVRPHAVVTIVLSLFVAAGTASVLGPRRLLTVTDDGEERGATFGADAVRFQMLRLADRFGRIPSNAHWRAKQHVDLLRSAREVRRVERDAGALLSPELFAGLANTSTASTGSVSGSSAVSPRAWRWLGPGNVGGRVRAIAISPTSADVVFAGSVGGGIWKTTNGGASWAPVDDFMAALSVATIVINPANPSVMYAGTGEGYGNGDAIMGAGILKSTDGGTTWTQLPATATGTAFQTVNRLSISTDGRVLLAATGSGLYRSLDGGSTMARVSTASPVLDVCFRPGDDTQAIAGGQGRAWYSRDGGATWVAATGIPSGAGRVEIAYARTQPGVVYASIDYNGGALYRSVDGGATFAAAGGAAGLLGTQGWYANALWVSPVDGNHVIVGGPYLRETADGGLTWRDLDYPIHIDQHAIVSAGGYNGSTNVTIYFGTDGGVFRADTAGFRSLNHNLGVTQFYSGAGNSASGVIIGGTQDTGTLLWKPGWGTSWTQPLGSDGGYTAADALDSSYFYTESIYLSLYRSTSGGTGFSYIGGGIADAGADANFIAPFVLDPNNSQRMFAGGASLWRSDNVKAATPTWKAVKGAATGGDYISAIAVAPGNSAIAWVGHSYGRVFKSTTATAATPTFSLVSAPTNAMVTRIAVDPSNWNIVYVATGGFGPANILKTVDGGVTWGDATGSGPTGLPDAPVYDVEIDPNNPETIYAATQVGVFVSSDGGGHWELPQDGPANVSVDDLFWMGSTLVAATHGRGMFAVDTSGSAAPAVAIAPTAIDFGSQTVGVTTAAHTLTLTNSGSAPLTVSSLALNGSQAAEFAWSGGDSCTGATLPPSTSCTRAITFRPAATGTRSATVLVYTNAATSPNAVALTGVGLAASASTLPLPWRAQDIGSVGAAGRSSYANGIFTISGAGADIWGTADAFRFTYQPLSGDGAVVARVASVQNVNAWTKAGVMIRETLDAASPHASMIVSPAKGLAFQYRSARGGIMTSVPAAGAAPKWVKVARAGSTFTASVSPDGSSWTTVGRATIGMATTAFVGLAVTSHVAGQLATATFDHAAVAPTPRLPSGWRTTDVGVVGHAGSAVESGGTFTVKGGGADIWGTADAFRYAYYQLAGDGSVLARVATVQNVNAWTKAGVMIRQSLDPGSIHASMFVSPANGVAFQRRKAAGGTSVSSGAGGAAPKWVKVMRSGQTITAKISADGVVWTTVGTDTVPFSGAVWAGLAVTSHDATQLAAATFDHVAVSSTLSSGWTHTDVGAVAIAGSASAANGVFTLGGSGADIWGTADAFQFAYRALAGDGQLVARITSIANTHRWAKPG